MRTASPTRASRRRGAISTRSSTRTIRASGSRWGCGSCGTSSSKIRGRSMTIFRFSFRHPGVDPGSSYASLQSGVPDQVRHDEVGEFDFRTGPEVRSEEHTSELQSLMRISYAVFCLKKKKNDETNEI